MFGKTDSKILTAVRRGMTFIEAIIAMFLLMIVMISVATVFTGSFGGFKKSRMLQKNTEEAEYAMNLVAKTLRTSSVLRCAPLACDGVSLVNATEVQFFDYSQGKCGKYAFSGGQLLTQVSVNNVSDSSACAAYAGGFTSQNMLNGYADGNFSVEKSDGNLSPANIGKAIIQIKVCADSSCQDKEYIQTSVSLRDYEAAGL